MSDEIEARDRVVVLPCLPGRFARYAGRKAVVVEVSPNGRVLALDFLDGRDRDYLPPEHVRATR